MNIQRESSTAVLVRSDPNNISISIDILSILLIKDLEIF